MSKITIREERCKGCELCVDACPKKILELADDKINAKGYHPVSMIDESKCTQCAACATMCPDIVITVGE